MNGLETIKVLRKKWPDLRVLVVTLGDNEHIITKMLQEGACGYFLKDGGMAELKKAIESVHINGVYFSEKVTRQFWNAVQKGLVKGIHLTEWEIMVMRECCTDKTCKEIAKELKVSAGSVESARDNMFKKLGIHSRVGLFIFAIKNGIVIVQSDIEDGAGFYRRRA